MQVQLSNSSMPDETPDKGDSLSNQAYLLLEREIVTLRLKPGQMLTEGALIKRLGMGRTPVREAIQRLAWEGLIEVRPRAGIQVSALNPADFAKVLDARLGAELVLARSAAKFASPQDDISFLGVGDRMASAAKRGDIDAFLDADKAFDMILSTASSNEYAARFAAPLQTHSRRFWFRLQRKDSLRLTAERHVALIAAIVARNEDAAENAVRELFSYLNGEKTGVN
jgi:DNA-binding GntR family transcriptional regulator